jgi:hypothetical protein
MILRIGNLDKFLQALDELTHLLLVWPGLDSNMLIDAMSIIS